MDVWLGCHELGHVFKLQVGTHRIASVEQTDGLPALGATTFEYDPCGNRAADYNVGLSHNVRTFTYDFRNNLREVRGEYPVAGEWHTYSVQSAFDAKNRRVFKAFTDLPTGKQSQWFFSYDPFDRLTEVRYTPDMQAPTT